jgi:hypothetical protein
MKKIAVVIVLFCVAPFALTCTAGAAGFLYGLATYKPRKKPVIIKYVNVTPEERAAGQAWKQQSAQSTLREEADLYPPPELACGAEGAESQNDASARDRSFPATPAF